jgi:hypothetical protein
MLKTDTPVKSRTMTARVKGNGKDKIVQPVETVGATDAKVAEKDATTAAAESAREYNAAPDAMIAMSAQPVEAETVTTYLWTTAADKLTFEVKDADAMLSGTYSTTVSPLVSSLGFVSAVPPVSEGYYKSVDVDTKGFANFGRNADLDPNGKFDEDRERSITCSLADQPEDLLDLLVPAF